MPRFLAALMITAANLFAQATGEYTCAIDGSVVNADTGEAIARAQVVLMSQGTNPGRQKSVTTDASGRWSFTGVACGQTQILATRIGFLQRFYGQPRIGGLFTPVILAPGEASRDVKIALTPQAVIAGKVMDDQNDPIQGAQITALTPRIVGGLRSFQISGGTTSNDLGEYRLAGMQPGRYIVCAAATGLAGPMNAMETDSATTIGSRCFPGPPEGGSASAMDIHGPDTRADFTLSRIPAVKVRGTILNAPRGVGISLTKRGVNTNNHSQAGMVRPDGVFEIHGVAPGSYMLSTDFWEAGKRLAVRLPIEVGGADVDGINVRLEAGFPITGTVRLDSKKGVPAAFPQVPVTLRAADPSGGGQLVWNKAHDGFTINELTPGAYRLESLSNGPWFMKSATLAGRDISKESVQLTQAAGPIDVVLSDDTGSLEGTVEDADGKPVATWVMVLQDGHSPRNIMSQADGHFTVPALAPGDYKVYAWDDWQQVEYANPDWMQRNSSPVRIAVESGQAAQTRLRQQKVPAF